MHRSSTSVLFIVFLALFYVSAAEAAGGAYLALKGGAFLPNSKGGSLFSNETGFTSFATGFNGEVAAGIRPESYAALELGTGYYASSLKVADTDSASVTKYRAFGVPITLTAKAILPLGKLECFAGAGLGYWFGQIHYRNERPASGSAAATTVTKDVNAGAVGYQAVTGADYRVRDWLDLGLEAKWFSAKPVFDFTEITGKKLKWEFGGTMINFVAKYRF